MAYLLNAGLAVSLNGTTWYSLTDHNRQPIEITTDLIQKENRMANGTMRKFVVSKKDTISVSWDNVPSSSVQATPFSITSAIVSGNSIFYVLSTDHNFTTDSVVRVSGFNDDRLNITAKVLNFSTNNFQVSNPKSAPDGTTTPGSTTTATRSSGGAEGSQSVTITTANPNIKTFQTITGTGFDNNTIVTGINQANTVVSFSPEAVSQVSGTITFTTPSASLIEILPSITTVDGNKGAAWLTSFYNANVGVPIYLKITESKMTDPAAGAVPTDSTFLSAKNTSKTYNVFMSNFNKTIVTRTRTTDYVNMNIEFTEI